MFPQEQEERDYRPQSELQNALETSRGEFSDDSEDINSFRHMGKWVVVCQSTAYCPRTDAILGQRNTLVDAFDTEEKAKACHAEHSQHDHEEANHVVLGPVAPPPPPPTDADIPF